MSDVSARLDVHCPDHEATRHLAAFIAKHAAADGEVGITLRLPIKVLLKRHTPLERRVLATLYPLQSITDPRQTYSVHLSHKNDSSSPYFSSALAVEKKLTDDCFQLVLAGHYEPMSFFGKLFDITLGRRIAQATAADLLRTIGNYVEFASARNGAARAGKQTHVGEHPINKPVFQA